jgi:hypothetical protein
MNFAKRVVTLSAFVGLLSASATVLAATSVLNSTTDALQVSGYTTNSSGSLVKATTGSGCYSNAVSGCNPQLVWYSGSGYGISSTSGDVSSPEHALDNNGRQESLLLNFGASTELDGVKIGWNGGYDSDITVLAWKPTEYMDPAVNSGTIVAPELSGQTYSQLLGLGWMLVGNYSNLQSGVEKAVNGGDKPVSSSYWLVLSYNTLGGTAKVGDSLDTSARGFVGDSSKDYGKFYSVSYSPGTKNENKVSEPSTALLLGAAMVGLVGWRNRRYSLR